MKPNVEGVWKIGICTLQLHADGTYRADYDPPLPNEPEGYRGTYQVICDSPYKREHWTSATGYFLQLDHIREPWQRPFSVPFIYRIDACEPDHLILGRLYVDDEHPAQQWTRVIKP